MGSMNKITTYNALLPLKGKTFDTRDELDNAVFPYFGPLQIIFQGEGHRDLVDRLLGAKWIVIENHKYVVVLEDVAPTKPAKVQYDIPTPTQEPLPEVNVKLNFDQIQSLITLATPVETPVVSNDVQELIALGLVEHVDSITPEAKVESIAQERAFVDSAVRILKAGRYHEAISFIENAIYVEQARYSSKLVCRLTTKGEQTLQRLRTQFVNL